MQNIYKLARNKQVFAYLHYGKKEMHARQGHDAHGMMAT